MTHQTMSSPSETSPLLSSDVRAVQTKDPVDVSAANFTAGRPKDNGHEDGTTVDGIKTNGTLTEDDQLERQSSIDNAREAQFKGNEEVAKKLKYILPAVGVGVSVLRVFPPPEEKAGSHVSIVLTVIDFPRCC